MLTEAAWSRNDAIVLLAFEERLAALHFVNAPPAFLAQLLPLDLPGMTEQDRVENLAWDEERQRMAVMLRRTTPDGDVKRRAAVHVLSQRPVLTATHVLDVHDPQPATSVASGWRPSPLFAGTSLLIAWGSQLTAVAFHNAV